MRKYISLVLGILLAMPFVYSQKVTFTEDFDGNINFTPTPASAWEKDSIYFKSPPYAYLGTVPNMQGGTAILETPVYVFSAYDFVYLRFKHICKVSPLDIVRVEYKITNQLWTPIPVTSYQGDATNYSSTGFNASSYDEWKADDSLAEPHISWWKEEFFDVSFETKKDNAVQFRFIIEHGNVPGTQISYGWLLDDVEIIASTYEVKAPIVEFVYPFIADTVYNTGPFPVHATVETQTSAPIDTTWLKYTVTKNGSTIVTDSVIMTTTVGNNSLWRAVIPQFEIGATVTYSITGKDTNNNWSLEKTKHYLILAPSGVPETVIVGNGTTLNYYIPVPTYGNYAWSCQLYLASEINPTSSGGKITKLAWDYASSGTYNLSDQTCYFRAVDDTLMNLGPFYPVEDGATKVWGSSSISFVSGWTDIELTTPFDLPAGKNLMIYWEYRRGSYSAHQFRVHATQIPMAMYRIYGTEFPASMNGGYGGSYVRGNARFVISSLPPAGNNSAALRSVDIPNPLLIVPKKQEPVVVTIQNKGFADLDSVNIYYSLNGSPAKLKTWKGKLSLEMTIQDTIDYYDPKFNGLDTFLVWISTPNGVTDPVTNNDTLTKIVFAKTPIQVQFVKSAKDTVFNIGPFLINADISSVMGSIPSEIWLKVSKTFEGNTRLDSFAMTLDPADNLWKTYIPSSPFGSSIKYSISLTDTLGNLINKSNEFFIKRALVSEITGTYIFGAADSLVGNPTPLTQFVYAIHEKQSWSRFIYLANEFSADVNDLFIAKIAWYNSSTDPDLLKTYTRKNFKVYMKITSEQQHVYTYLNPVGEGATLVYSGDIKTQPKWNEITLINPFFVPKGSNLIIYFEENTGSASTNKSISWAFSDCAVSNPCGNAFDGGGIMSNYEAPVLRFSFSGSSLPDSNSVALDKVLPESSVDLVSTDIQAVIRNRGVKILDSCRIYWTLNGNLEGDTLWKGNLREDYTDTITIGNFTPTKAGGMDVIEVWVSTPNGVTDLTNDDDTLTVNLFACGNGMSGIQRIGSSSSAKYASIEDAIAELQICGIDKKVILALEDDTYNIATNWEMEALKDCMTPADTLVLTSFSGNTSAVVLKPTAIGLRFKNNQNIIVQNITIDATNGTNAIDFIGNCNYIVIRDCRFFSDTVNPATTKELISKVTSGTSKIDNIYIINNEIYGGNYGIRLQVGYDASYNSIHNGRIIIDSNILISNKAMAIYANGIVSCNNNTVLSSITDISGTWKGIEGYHGPDCRYTGNRIIQRCANITTPTGINLSVYSNLAGTSDTAIVANNEIILAPTGTGIGISFIEAKVLNNSILMSGTSVSTGTSAPRGISMASNARGLVKNNNIVMMKNTMVPLYSVAATSLAGVDIDYNNRYALSDIVCGGTPTLTLKAWSETKPTDIHSTCILPDFVNPAASLELASGTDLLCPVISPVYEDINGVQRMGNTLKGCYGLPATTANATLTAIEGLQEGFIVGQSDSVKVVLYNTGTTSLSSVNLGWSVNNTTQNGNISLPVTLMQGQSASLYLGTLNYPAKKVTVKIWINSLNGGTADTYQYDDTIISSVYICQSAFSDTLIIGQTGDFPNLTEAYKALQLCGMNGDVTLAFQPGNYIGNIDFSKKDSLLGNSYSLTLTSVTGDTADVILSSEGDAVIRCNNTSNLIFKNITIDATRGTYGIQFTGTGSNIVVDNCHILANTVGTTNTTGYAGIYKPGSTGVLSDLTIKNSLIEGGYYGIYLYGISTNYGRNMVIDSNTITNQYSSPLFLYYLNFNSISYNHITPRSTGAGATWRAFDAYNLRNGGNIIGNRISANNPAITSTLYGMYLSNMDTALIANNEISLNANASTTEGISILYPRQVQVINNTVYTVKAGTSGTNRAYHCTFNTAAYSSTIKNNIFVASGGAVSTIHAIYCDGTIANFTDHYLDYNNYYSLASTGLPATNLGYIGSTPYTTFPLWQDAISKDANSVNILPVFADATKHLALATYPGSLLCPRLSSVVTDIRNMERPEITAMGAYTQFENGQDILLERFVGWNDIVIQKQVISVDVVLFNNGIVPVTEADFKWTLNGGTPTSAHWDAPPVLDSLEECTVHIGSFTVSNTVPKYEVVVWIEKVNNENDTVNWRDTIRASAALEALVEFVDPFIPDTITSLSFVVNTYINTLSGAPVTPPKMTAVYTHDTITVYDTISMIRNGDIWQAVVPPQHYGTKVVYAITVSDTINNSTTLIDSTYSCSALSLLGNPALTSPLSLITPFNTAGCQLDSTPVKVALTNYGTNNYDFSKDTILFGLEIIDADSVKHELSVPFTGILEPGENIIELMSSFPTIHPGAYEIKIWLGCLTDNTPYKDTLRYTYISGKIGLPVDEYFNSSIPLSLEFDIMGNNSATSWTIIPQGRIGADTVVKPVFGDGMLSFTGSRGATSTLTTRQMDLSRTVNPSLSFWYFHDTVPSKDYTDVRITADGRMTYLPLLSLTKYNADYGWKQYIVDLPSYAVNQCVMLTFEAMEKSNGDITQYIDRIRITAEQDIAVTEILTSAYNVCDLENKELNVVLSNLTDPALNYASTPIMLTLEVKETGQTFVDTLTSGILSGSSSDTVTLATDFDFTKGTYTFKAYLSLLFDVDRSNDTIETSLTVDYGLEIEIEHLSIVNCLKGEMDIWQEVLLINTGDMDLFDIDLILQIDTGVTGDPAYDMFSETNTDIIHGKDTLIYTFSRSYKVPWNEFYYPRLTASLTCNPDLVTDIIATSECVDMRDLYVVSIDNPSVGNDTIGSPIQVKASIANHSDINTFSNINITVVVENAQRQAIETFTGDISTIAPLSTTSYTFANSYIVPNDTVYYLTVYIDSSDNCSDNDTLLRIKRTTVKEDKDLFIVSVDNPSSGKDVVGISIQPSVSLHNGSKYEDFASLRVTVLVENSQRIQTAIFTETTEAIEKLSTISHTFTNFYTVPNDSVYHLTVYIDSYDNHPSNDTTKITRYTESVGIAPMGSINAFSLDQNIPNPANNSTRIDYSVPEAGEVVFHVHSISGQLLYSKTIEASSGTNSVELNTSTFAAGVYFYSMEYKGQRLVKQLIINN